MPKKPEDFRIQGVSFEQAMKRVATAKPPAPPKPINKVVKNPKPKK